MKIDKNTTLKIAKLSRIKIEANEVDELSSQLSAIVDWVEQLNEVDVENVDPMTSVTPTLLKQRPDLINDGNQQEKILSNAPDSREGFFAVPKVVE